MHGGPRVVCVGRVVKGTSCGVPVDVASQRRVILPGTASVSQRALYANQMASSACARDESIPGEPFLSRVCAVRCLHVLPVCCYRVYAPRDRVDIVIIDGF